MAAYVDAAWQHPLPVAERIIGKVAENPVLAGTCGVDPHHTFGEAMMSSQIAEGTDTVRSAVPIRVEHHKTGLPERQTGHRIGEQVPELADRHFICGGSGLPSSYTRLLVKAQRHWVVRDPDGKHRQTGRCKL
jgi:hypothetical protein